MKDLFKIILYFGLLNSYCYSLCMENTPEIDPKLQDICAITCGSRWKLIYTGQSTKPKVRFVKQVRVYPRPYSEFEVVSSEKEKEEIVKETSENA